jgi:hypothetical protein
MTSHPAPIQILQFSALRPRSAAAHTPKASPAHPRQVAAAALASTPVSADDRAAIRTGAQQERRRWMAVLGSSAFFENPTLAAHLLAQTSQSPAEIVALLGQVAADAETVRLNSPEAIGDRWAAAHHRAGIAAGGQ